MWTPVTSSDNGEPSPASRCKHSATLLQGNLYLLGGRSGNVPLKDFWKFSLSEGTWTQIYAGGEKPPCLQEHSAVAYKDQIYVFGGEVGFSSGSETPLWVYSVSRDFWRKVRTRRGVQVPRACRGHTALVHRGSMLIYGGYQDLKGSSADLWAFHFETESWHLLTGGEAPPARHRHSAVLYDDCMWVYGGMTDLTTRADLWRWDTRQRSWTNVRPQRQRGGPGPRQGHAAAAADAHMLLLGGEGQTSGEIWRFAFHTEAWDRIDCRGDKPNIKSDAVALTISENVFNKSETRNNEGVTYFFPNNTSTASSFISRLAALRGTTCHYTVLQADSTESLLSNTPQRLPKSKSAYNTTNATSGIKNATSGTKISSVPNFSQLEDNKLVDTDDEEDTHQVIHVKPADNKQILIYKDKSYSSHLGRADSTSDYASLDMSHSSSSGFCNPNYVAAAALLGSSEPSAPAQGPELELKTRRRVGRAASASRAEARVSPTVPTPPALYVFLVGGKEPHVTIFKRPVNIWKLQLY